jgi:hypothetical protein
MLQHSPFAYDIANTLRPHDWSTRVSFLLLFQVMGGSPSNNPPSSFLMYFRANDRPVSFLSTIRTLPKAPRPTTLRRRKWFRFTNADETLCQQGRMADRRLVTEPAGELTLTVEVDGLALAVAHCLLETRLVPFQQLRPAFMVTQILPVETPYSSGGVRNGWDGS